MATRIGTGPSGTGPGAGERAREGALSLGVGLVPCTGAVLILLYAMANDILFAGVLLVVAIAAGMALTMGALGVLSIVARNAVARSGRSGWEWAGALCRRHGLRRCARDNRARRRSVLGGSAIDIRLRDRAHRSVRHSPDQRPMVHGGKARRYRAANWTAQRMIGVEPLASTKVLSSAAGHAPAEQPVLVLDGLARAYGVAHGRGDPVMDGRRWPSTA